MNRHTKVCFFLLTLLLFSGCSRTKDLRPEDAPYNVLKTMWVSGLQKHSSLSQVIGSIESELATRYTNHPPFHFHIDRSIRSLKVHSRSDTSRVNDFLRNLREGTGVYIVTKKQTVYIKAPPCSPPCNLFNLPTCDYNAITATIFEAVSDINARLEDQYGTNIPVKFSASLNISTNETLRFIAGTPSIKVYSEMVAYATLSNYRWADNSVHFYNALADEELVIEPAGPEYPPQSVGPSDP